VFYLPILAHAAFHRPLMTVVLAAGATRTQQHNPTHHTGIFERKKFGISGALFRHFPGAAVSDASAAIGVAPWLFCL